MQAGQTNKSSAICNYSALVPARRINMSDRINNQQLIINCTTVQAEGILIPHLHKAVTLSARRLACSLLAQCWPCESFPLRFSPVVVKTEVRTFLKPFVPSSILPHALRLMLKAIDDVTDMNVNGGSKRLASANRWQ